MFALADQAPCPALTVAIKCDLDPAILPRLLGLVSNLNLIPVFVHAEQRQDHFLVEMGLSGASDEQWHFLLRKLAQPPQVFEVST